MKKLTVLLCALFVCTIMQAQERIAFSVEIVQRKIADVLNCIDNESSIIEYANQVNAIIRDTSVNPELKSDLKTVTDITINSKLYWDAVQ